jgi:hypothetical protein
LFGKMLQKLTGVKPGSLRNKYLCYTLNFFVAIILSFFISLIEIYIGATSFWDGIVVGFILWIGFVFTTQITSVIWVKNSDRVKIFFIRNGFLLLTFLVMGAILVG